MTINDYFDQIFCINLERRKDRWKHAQEQAAMIGLDKLQRFNGYEIAMDGWSRNGNAGCTNSHRALLEIISFHQIPRALILEDDFECRFPETTNSLFEEMIGEVPSDWDMLYLGGHYQEKPRLRISPHVILTGGILTTSSYGITWQQARRMAPYIFGQGPIDAMYIDFNRSCKCYMFQPRLMVQYESQSDLTNQWSANRMCMEDKYHESLV